MTKKSELIKMQPQAPAQAMVMTLPDLMAQAVATGDIDRAKQIWEMIARNAFNQSMASAKAEMPVIIKDQVVDFTSQKGRTNYMYENMATIARVVDPILTKFGLSYRYRTVGDKETITVTCIVAHKDGHSEENSLTGPIDTSGNKNPIQAIGSAQTYLQRYTLKAALGLAASKDDDARSVDDKKDAGQINEEQADFIKKLVEDVGSEYENVSGLYKGFFRKFGIEKIGDLPASEYDNAIDALKDKRKNKNGEY